MFSLWMACATGLGDDIEQAITGGREGVAPRVGDITGEDERVALGAGDRDHDLGLDGAALEALDDELLHFVRRAVIDLEKAGIGKRDVTLLVDLERREGRVPLLLAGEKPALAGLVDSDGEDVAGADAGFRRGARAHEAGEATVPRAADGADDGLVDVDDDILGGGGGLRRAADLAGVVGMMPQPAMARPASVKRPMSAARRHRLAGSNSIIVLDGRRGSMTT